MLYLEPASSSFSEPHGLFPIVLIAIVIVSLRVVLFLFPIVLISSVVVVSLRVVLFLTTIPRILKRSSPEP